MCRGQLLRLPMMYEVNIFLTNRYVPIPEVLARERLLVDNAGASGFYHVIARPVPSPCDQVLERITLEHGVYAKG